ncbi:MAG: serine protease [Oscillospiraceae bacterium]|jgi:serine protease Do|nr:serine protease [Oscillospiraceae bacterium]
MDNYLSHRWPQGPGVQPPPVPHPAALRRPVPVRRSRSPRRWLVPAVCIALCLALLGGISFWAVNGLAALLSSVEFRDPFGDPPRTSWQLPDQSDWSPEDLPWGEPDPSVSLSVEPAAGSALSGRDVHQRVLPSIVYVEATAKGHTGAFSGTGVVVTGSGYVLTNYHIIEETDYIEVMLLSDRGRTMHPAQVIGFDEDFDIAVLKFDGEGLGLTPARLGDSDLLAVGDPVYAEGNPLGYLTGSMTEGIVSALERESEVNSDGMGMIQTSAALNPGNSGGALVNGQGQVVGITSAKITGLMRERDESLEDAAVLENIGLALPITDILPFVNRILATGRSWRPSIGITCFEAAADGRNGLQVKSVEKGVPAREAGLREGDLIVSANGRPVPTLTDLRRAIYRAGLDGEFHCIVVRDGAEVPVSFALVDKLEE